MKETAKSQDKTLAIYVPAEHPHVPFCMCHRQGIIMMCLQNVSSSGANYMFELNVMYVGGDEGKLQGRKLPSRGSQFEAAFEQ